MGSQPRISIQVKSLYLADESSPRAHEFVFRYYVSIKNEDNQAFKLISRYWKVQDKNEQTQEIQGQGVCGKQPTLEAGENYTYDSLVMLETPLGTMEGAFTFRDTLSHYHDISIAPFVLAKPDQLH